MTVNRLTRRLSGDDRIELFRSVREAVGIPYFRVMESATAPTVRVEGADKIMLGSNNYLGLADHPAIRQGAQDALDRFGAAITGSRLLNGTIDLHLELEAEIAAWHGTEDAMVFTTGYQTNVGTISAVVGPGDLVVVDSAAHASIRDGAALSGATVRTMAHNDIGDLERILGEARDDAGATLVIVDGLYSMEGDIPPLREISDMCRRHGAALMVDEAHSLGMFGPARTGAAELFGVHEYVDIRMASLSKGPASTGGFIAGSADMLDTLRVHARAFLFTTSGVPAAIGASLAAVRLIRSEEGAHRARRALDNASVLRTGLAENGIDVGALSPLPDGGSTATPIVALHVGDDVVAMNLWRLMFDRGVFASAALYPAVPRAGALLRLCVMASHTDEQLRRAIEIISESTAMARV
ncbi:aminotransferase class I/II-fold pyridoxal phosphate-dependent enzyme [Rhodococcus sp. D2-41]|uniref:8-amino-7-oxononanoate synthase n=1 Tax=Speluncibacter jeojiensis TaxID=2710754 RepID=A0A9X4LY95_9ACTN|nr:aminotransferase class I/II-fold pyridoxal phosphate-dependent enzyme [Rhodococcus sp. D2-41]MDG3010839.1 aminotransferase class I/II-fold pyridoxal phosphate-dependent enzyme [Rhodococcus sp. D2-41]MDG3013811.1 aminotransferase class I/II-fold pyridoxal phosphate-dependent enzyme [Corynebacteriales bacterium D3-21]